MTRSLRLPLPLAFTTLSLVLVAAFALFDRAFCSPCDSCVAVPDTCCDAQPLFQGAEAPFFSPNVVVGTREAHNAWPYVVTVYDLGSPLPSPLENQAWNTILRFHGPFNSWNADSLGSVFGLTLDRWGNIFVTHTSSYLADSIGKVFGGGPGAVYRIDAVTGVITTFCRLPNYQDPSVSPQEWWPGLGNITYDCRHDQFFVTNIEDGRIYRLKAVGVNGPTGTIVEVFDPLSPDLGPTNYLNPSPTPGWAPLGERLWGVQKHGDRVFYSVWAEDYTSAGSQQNEIRSVSLDAFGAFVPGSDRHELWLPSLPSQVFSMPVSDISFSAGGKMLLGERGIELETIPSPHQARLLEYVCSGGCWLPGNTYDVGAASPENSSGGVDYDRHAWNTQSIGRVWSSGDALQWSPNTVYGYAGFRPSGGNWTTTMLIDADNDLTWGDKTYTGDIEAPGCPNLAVGSICGRKFSDTNFNGVFDGGDTPIAGWSVVLNGPGGPYFAITDANGNYCFTNVPAGAYTLAEVGVAGWTQTAPPGGSYAITLAGGAAVTGRDFGNYHCPSGGCVTAPSGMGGWWPMNDAIASPTAADVTHLSPAKNVLQLSGGAAIAAGGKVGRSLCFGGELDLAFCPNANTAGLAFGVGSFAVDAWLSLAPSGGGPRVVAEKRQLVSSAPYRTRGWSLYLVGQQLLLEIGNGATVQLVAGPTIAASSWQHVAVSCDRTSGQGRWYVNGALVPGFSFAPLPGFLTTPTDLYVGHAGPAFGSAGFEGCIDELEIFAAPLSAASAAKLYAAGPQGKCPEYCRLPEVTSICKNATSVNVCFNVCNSTGTPQTYAWSLAGLPAGPGCSVPGPTTFTPSAGAVTVAPGQCSANLCVTIPRPPGLTAQGATACYVLNVVNTATGECQSCTGTIRADNGCWCVTPAPGGVVPVAARVAPPGTTIGIGVGHPCDPIDRLAYSLSAVYTAHDLEDPLLVSLNGLPPGEAVFGEIELAPDASGEVTVDVTFPNGYDASAPYEIVLSADTDGDGVAERLGGTMIRAEYVEDGTVGVGEEAPAAATLGLAARPNPFLGDAAITFTLPRAGAVELGVYDLGGRLVRTLHRGSLAAGAQRFEWNGRDARGREVAGGIYFAKLRAAGANFETKVVKLR